MSGDDHGLDALARLVAACGGPPLDAYKDRCLRRRLAVRMRAVGVHSYGDYAAVLERAPDELARLRDALTISVTRFYRNAETWDALRQRFLPALVARSATPVRAWSAGCATGEEAYTLAMLLLEAAEGAGRRGAAAVHVDASDVDEPALARLRESHYRADALLELPPDLRARWCRATAGGIAVEPALRQAVHPFVLDLVREPCPGTGYDVVACRNVLIYFGREVQERLFEEFARALRPGGLLVLGKVEAIAGPARHRFAVADARERIYERKP